MSTLTPEIRKELAVAFDAISITPSRRAQVNADVATILSHKALYQQIEDKTRVVWYMTGVFHIRECSGSMTAYLGNGDPIDQVTTDVPSGRGPFPDFVAGAVDALAYEKTAEHIGGDLSIGNLLAVTETWNGEGYREKGVVDPYNFAATSAYKSGKFVGDHEYSEDAVDQQSGCAALLLTLWTQGEIELLGEAISVKFPPVTPPAGEQQAVHGFVLRSTAYIGVRAACANVGAMLDVTNDPNGNLVASVTKSGRPASKLAVTTIAGTGYCRARGFAQACGYGVEFDADSGTLTFS